MLPAVWRKDREARGVSGYMVDILIMCRHRGQADKPRKSTAIQLAKLSGFTIIATTAREENRALVASLGATHIFRAPLMGLVVGRTV